MKLLVVVVLAACQTKPTPPPPAAAGSAAPAPAPPPIARTAEICQQALAALSSVATCGAKDDGLRAARASFEGVINAMTQVGADPKPYDIACARMLVALEKDVGSDCSIPVDSALRDRVMRTLDEYYNERTPVTKTGDAAADAILAKIAAVRDATCDCRTSACLDKIDAQLTALPTLPVTAPQAARDLGTKLLENTERCAQRARM